MTAILVLRRDIDIEADVTELDRPAALEEVEDDVLALNCIGVYAVRHDRASW